MDDINGDELIAAIQLLLERKSNAAMAVGRIAGGDNDGLFDATLYWMSEGDSHSVITTPKSSAHEALQELLSIVED